MALQEARQPLVDSYFRLYPLINSGHGGGETDRIKGGALVDLSISLRPFSSCLLLASIERRYRGVPLVIRVSFPLPFILSLRRIRLLETPNPPVLQRPLGHREGPKPKQWPPWH